MEKLLPIGTVVLLKNNPVKLMITGVKQFNPESEDEIFDYVGVLFPIGYIGNKGHYLFNNDQINDIIFKGYEDEYYEAFSQFISENF